MGEKKRIRRTGACTKCNKKDRKLVDGITAGAPICDACYVAKRRATPESTTVNRIKAAGSLLGAFEIAIKVAPEEDRTWLQETQDKILALNIKWSTKEHDVATELHDDEEEDSDVPSEPLPPPTELSKVEVGDYFVSKVAVEGEHAVLQCCVRRKANGNVAGQSWTGKDWKPATVVPSTTEVTIITPDNAKKLYECYSRPPGVKELKPPAPPKPMIVAEPKSQSATSQ